MRLLINLLIAVFATYRVSHMMVLEEGPFDAFTQLRAKVDPKQETWIGRGINCIWCTSFWIALPFSVLATRKWSFTNWMATAGGVLTLRQMLSGIK